MHHVFYFIYLFPTHRINNSRSTLSKPCLQSSALPNMEPAKKRLRVDVSNDDDDDDTAVVVPDWLAASGLAPAALRQLMAWMSNNNLCFALDSARYHEDVFAHPVCFDVAVGYKGCMERLVCSTCCDACPCCGDPCDDLYDEDGGDDCKHDFLCYKCLMGDRSCDCDWSETCPNCKKGCRESQLTHEGKFCVRCDPATES